MRVANDQRLPSNETQDQPPLAMANVACNGTCFHKVKGDRTPTSGWLHRWLGRSSSRKHRSLLEKKRTGRVQNINSVFAQLLRKLSSIALLKFAQVVICFLLHLSAELNYFRQHWGTREELRAEQASLFT